MNKLYSDISSLSQSDIGEIYRIAFSFSPELKNNYGKYIRALYQLVYHSKTLVICDELELNPGEQSTKLKNYLLESLYKKSRDILDKTHSVVETYLLCENIRVYLVKRQNTIIRLYLKEYDGFEPSVLLRFVSKKKLSPLEKLIFKTEIASQRQLSFAL